MQYDRPVHGYTTNRWIVGIAQMPLHGRRTIAARRSLNNRSTRLCVASNERVYATVYCILYISAR